MDHPRESVVCYVIFIPSSRLGSVPAWVSMQVLFSFHGDYIMSLAGVCCTI